MSRLGRLSDWLGRSGRHARRNAEERSKRLRRWFHRPLVEQLEDRLAPGSIVVGISELLHGGPEDPYAEIPEAVTPEGLARSGDHATTARATTADLATPAQDQDPWPIYAAPPAPPLPSRADQDIFLQQDQQDNTVVSMTSTSDSGDWRESAFDTDLFRALDDVFGSPAGGAPQGLSTPGPFDAGGQPSGGGGAGLPSAGDSGGGSASPMIVSSSSSD